MEDRRSERRREGGWPGGPSGGSGVAWANWETRWDGMEGWCEMRSATAWSRAERKKKKKEVEDVDHRQRNRGKRRGEERKGVKAT